MKRDGLAPALPLAALFVACFVAPLCVLVGISVSSGPGGGPLTMANYVKFLIDRFDYSILLDTLLLGVKATALCFVFGFPIAWICARARPRLQTAIIFLVILPILTS